MCGRFVSTANPERIASYFGAEADVETLAENFNVAPTQDIYGVVTGPDGVVRVQTFTWGLIPSWAKDRKIGSKMINARAETLADKPAFKGLFAKKRCLIPMDGYYEWQAGQPGGPVNAKGQPLKQPTYIHRLDGEPMAVAGLWSAWKDKDDNGRWLQSATIVTTSANDEMQAIHDRMPVMVPASRWAEWLDPSNQDIMSLVDLFAERNDGILTMHPVSTEVNSVRNNDATLIDPV